MSPKKILFLVFVTCFFSASVAAAQCCGDIGYLQGTAFNIVNGGSGFYPPFYGGYGGAYYNPYAGYGYGPGYGPQPPMGRQERMAVGAGIGAAIGGGASGNWRGSAIGSGIGALIGLAAGREHQDQGEQPRRPVQQGCRRGEISLENQTPLGLEVTNDNRYLGVLGPGQTICLAQRGNLVGVARREREVRYAEIWTTPTGLAFKAPTNN